MKFRTRWGSIIAWFRQELSRWAMRPRTSMPCSETGIHRGRPVQKLSRVQRASSPGAADPAILPGKLRGDRRSIPEIRGRDRLSKHPGGRQVAALHLAGFGRGTRCRPTPRGWRKLGGFKRVLPLARQTRPAQLQASYRGPMGIRLPCRHQPPTGRSATRRPIWQSMLCANKLLTPVWRQLPESRPTRSVCSTCTETPTSGVSIGTRWISTAGPRRMIRSVWSRRRTRPQDGSCEAGHGTSQRGVRGLPPQLRFSQAAGASPRISRRCDR